MAKKKGKSMTDQTPSEGTKNTSSPQMGGLTRRQFLTTATVAGAGVAISVAACSSPLEAMTSTLTKTETVNAPPSTTTQTVTQEVKLQKAIGHVSYDPANCAGCRTCMAVCSLFHDGAVCPDMARIQVSAPTLKIFEAEGITCKQCEGPECLYVCPTGALHIDSKTGARVIDAAKCIGCQLCLQACPQYPNSPIRYDANAKKCLKCDLCGGDPQCVKFCPKSVAVTPHLYPEKDRVLKFVKTQA